MVRRVKLSPIPGLGPNSSCSSASRWTGVSLFWISHADASVIAAPKPTISWYVVPSSTTIRSRVAGGGAESKWTSVSRDRSLAPLAVVSHNWTAGPCGGGGAGGASGGCPFGAQANAAARMSVASCRIPLPTRVLRQVVVDVELRPGNGHETALDAMDVRFQGIDGPHLSCLCEDRRVEHAPACQVEPTLPLEYKLASPIEPHSVPEGRLGQAGHREDAGAPPHRVQGLLRRHRGVRRTTLVHRLGVHQQDIGVAQHDPVVRLLLPVSRVHVLEVGLVQVLG